MILLLPILILILVWFLISIWYFQQVNRSRHGNSVLTNNGNDWKRHRLLLNEVFSKKKIVGFHHIFQDFAALEGDADEFLQALKYIGLTHRTNLLYMY